MELELSKFDESFLEASYLWLQDDELRGLIASPSIDKVSQKHWFESLSTNKTYLIHGVKYAGAPIGVVGVKNILNGEGEYWGYIGEKEFWGHGIGRWMVESVLVLCQDAGIERLYLKVLVGNTRAINLYKRCDFLEYDKDDKFIYMSRFVLNSV